MFRSVPLALLTGNVDDTFQMYEYYSHGIGRIFFGSACTTENNTWSHEPCWDALILVGLVG